MVHAGLFPWLVASWWVLLLAGVWQRWWRPSGSWVFFLFLSVLAAAIIAKNADGSLRHFDWLGYIVVATSIVSLALMYFVQRSVARRDGRLFV